MFCAPTRSGIRARSQFEPACTGLDVRGYIGRAQQPCKPREAMTIKQSAKIPARPPDVTVGAAPVWKRLLSRPDQEALLSEVVGCVRLAPFLRPVTPSGRKMSVEMTSAGRVGWVTDRAGYRYERQHPGGCGWPPIPALADAVWRSVSGVDRAPDSCLINLYRGNARMGMHQDLDEGDLTWPVVSISLGDDALFRVGGTARKGPTQSLWLESGDVVVLTGESRLAYHGVDRLRPGTSTLVAGGGRINLTLRVVVDV